MILAPDQTQPNKNIKTEAMRRYLRLHKTRLLREMPAKRGAIVARSNFPMACHLTFGPTN
jgi:hypothetical protein